MSYPSGFCNFPKAVMKDSEQIRNICTSINSFYFLGRVVPFYGSSQCVEVVCRCLFDVCYGVVFCGVMSFGFSFNFLCLFNFGSDRSMQICN